MPDGFSLPSFAKINWTLRILGKRADGFHELCTVFQTISLCDTLHFEPSSDVTLTCSDERIPVDGGNLVIKAAELLRREHGVDQGAKIHLDKSIPSPGGVGGGSSNAATAMIGLCRLWGVSIDMALLLPIAVELGSDVPFFLTGGTALGTGRGEMIEPLTDKTAAEMLLVSPDASVSTTDAFRGLAAPALTSGDSERTLTVCRNEAESLDPLHSVLINDFEPTVFETHPEIGRVKETLLELGARNAAMSGSGASVYAVFDNKETRQAAQKALDNESTWRKFAVSTVSRAKYAKALGI